MTELWLIIAGVIVGCACLLGGLILGWYLRDRMRGPSEESFPFYEAPLPEPIDIPIAGRHVEKKE